MAEVLSSKVAKEEQTSLKLDNIVKVYGDGDTKVQALKGVDLTFRKNEFVSILGPSGCGKTTLLNIIGGLDRYTSGDLVIEGKSTKNYNDKDWDAYRNNCIGFVFQSYNLIPHQTVLGNVELALELSGIKKGERKERAIKMLEKVGLKDQLHKKPNQLSGGQMQRVAIARALINDPEIILADEPTGALDTETSVQIMELLKEVAKDRLVIMVTHNPELAEKYSTRIIKFLDGEKVGDSNPFTDVPVKQTKTRRKPKMGFKTAFALSLKNLISKRARTTLTAIAGSIGIVGVALVLAVSNGFSIYMNRMQTDTLATNPLIIKENDIDLSTFNELYDVELKEQYPELDNIIIQRGFSKLEGMLKGNKLSNQTILNDIILNEKVKNNAYTIQKGYGFDMNDYFYTDITLDGDKAFTAIDQLVNMIEHNYEEELKDAAGLSTSFVRQYIPTIQEMPDSSELLNKQYDFLYKTNENVSFDNLEKNQIVLVVDKMNSISDISLALLGLNDITITTNEKGNPSFKFASDTNQELAKEQVIGKKIYIALNDKMYTKQPDGNWKQNIIVKDYNTELALEVVGIVRAKKKVDGILKEGFAYTSKLTEYVLQENAKSPISSAAVELENNIKDLDALSKKNLPDSEKYVQVYNFNPFTLSWETATTSYSARSLGAISYPSSISIYPKDFESKEAIKNYFDEYNNSLSQDKEADIITYSDMMSMLFEALTTLVDAVTYVLVAFTSISLVVSSVMIGIITYVSVVERTKEIGVLRSMGASKNEISNVFNAESFLIGLFAGLLGIAVTYLLSIPINIITSSVIADIGSLVLLKPTTALILVAISFGLTMIAGLIPSRIAAKKDPVVALRSE